MAKKTKKSSELIEKSKKKRADKVEKEVTKKKKGKKDKAVSAEKPVKKTKKAAAVEAPVKKKKKKAVEEVAAPKKKKKGAVEEKPAKGKKGKASKAATPRVRKPKKIIPNDVKPIKVKQNRTQTLDAIIEGADIQSVLGKKIEISERQEKKVVKAVMDAIERNILGHVAKGGSGQFSFTNLFKIVTKKVDAKPRRKGINPFTKIEQWFEAKPATVRVKARPMKRLKDAAL